MSATSINLAAEMNGSTDHDLINRAIEKHLGAALPEIQPGVDTAKLAAPIRAEYGAEVAEAAMKLYERVTTMYFDWRTDTHESVQADVDSMLRRNEPWLTDKASDVLVRCCLAIGW